MLDTTFCFASVFVRCKHRPQVLEYSTGSMTYLYRYPFCIPDSSIQNGGIKDRLSVSEPWARVAQSICMSVCKVYINAANIRQVKTCSTTAGCTRDTMHGTNVNHNLTYLYPCSYFNVQPCRRRRRAEASRMSTRRTP